MTHVRIIPPSTKGHNCLEFLPSRDGGYGSTGEPEGTLAQCPRCKRWWFCAPCYEHYGPTTVWSKVRWYHFGYRRIIDLH